jgi:hypothetical protein
VAYDRDAAGRQGARRLADRSARVRLTSPHDHKDLTALHAAGADLRSWVQYLLGRWATPPAS